MVEEMAMPDGLEGSTETTRKDMRPHGIGALGIERLWKLFGSSGS